MKKKSLYFIALAVLVILFFSNSILKKLQNSANKTQQSVPTVTDGFATLPPAQKEDLSKNTTSESKETKPSSPQKLTFEEIDKAEAELKKQSDEVIKQTFKQAGLSAPIPNRFLFKQINSSHDIFGMSGLNKETKSALTFVYKQSEVKSTQALTFINDLKNEIPNTANKNIKWVQANQPIDFAPESGLSSATLWGGADEDGLVYRLLVFHPADHKKTYFLVISGYPDEISKLDDFNSKSISQVKLAHQ